MQKPLKAFPTQDHDAHIAAHVAFMLTRMVQINPQVYSALQAHISEHVSLKAQGEVGAMVQKILICNKCYNKIQKQHR